jgi:hypothetical protein
LQPPGSLFIILIKEPDEHCRAAVAQFGRLPAPL